MSERADRIVAALDRQWRPTREIADRAEVEDYVRLSAIYHTLGMAVKHGRAEKRTTVSPRGVRVAEWRLAQ